jgi:hypothetical protein
MDVIGASDGAAGHLVPAARVEDERGWRNEEEEKENQQDTGRDERGQCPSGDSHSISGRRRR